MIRHKGVHLRGHMNLSAIVTLSLLYLDDELIIRCQIAFIYYKCFSQEFFYELNFNLAIGRSFMVFCAKRKSQELPNEASWEIKFKRVVLQHFIPGIS